MKKGREEREMYIRKVVLEREREEERACTKRGVQEEREMYICMRERGRGTLKERDGRRGEMFIFMREIEIDR